MNPPLYRITGVYCYPANVTSRCTVRRSQKADLAYYEDLEHAKRGLIGLRANNSSYSDLRIEMTYPTWEAVDA